MKKKTPHKTKKKGKQDENVDQNRLHIFYKHISYYRCIQARTEAGLITTLNIKENIFEHFYWLSY